MTEVKLPDTTETDFHWTIKNLKNVYKRYAVGERIKSPVFTVKNDTDCYYWRLQFYPKGPLRGKGKSLSLYLSLCGLREALLKTECICSFIYSESRTIRTTYKCIHNFTRVNEVALCAKMKFIKLLDNMSNPDLIILTTVRIWFIGRNNLIPIQPNITEGTDVSIKVNGKVFNVHKSILIEQSSVFDAMFTYDTKENKENVIEIDDVDDSVIEQLISFMYSGIVDNLDSLVEKLLYCAEKYAIAGLKNTCENYYIKNMKTDNVIDILTLADQFNAMKLKEIALQFLGYHIKEVIDTEEYKIMAKSQPVFLDYVLRLSVLMNGSNISNDGVSRCRLLSAITIPKRKKAPSN